MRKFEYKTIINPTENNLNGFSELGYRLASYKDDVAVMEKEVIPPIQKSYKVIKPIFDYEKVGKKYLLVRPFMYVYEDDYSIDLHTSYLVTHPEYYQPVGEVESKLVIE